MSNTVFPRSGGGSPANRRDELRARQAEEERKNRIRKWTMLGAITLTAALIAWVALWGITRAVKPSSTPPTAAIDGLTIVVGQPDARATVAIYQDFMCPFCGEFERLNRDDIDQLVTSGTAKVELHLMNFLDAQSQGTNYSTRAASALIAVADAEPEHVLEFNAALYDQQPAEGSTGLSDSEIAQLAREAGVSQEVYDTFSQVANADRVDQSNQAALDDGITSTPTVRINGDDLPSTQTLTQGALRAAVEKAARP